MWFGKCPDCKKNKWLTKHSLKGHHRPPYIRVCRSCHDKRDGMNPPKPKFPGKYQPGTPKSKRKKK